MNGECKFNDDYYTTSNKLYEAEVLIKFSMNPKYSELNDIIFRHAISDAGELLTSYAEQYGLEFNKYVGDDGELDVECWMPYFVIRPINDALLDIYAYNPYTSYRDVVDDNIAIEDVDELLLSSLIEEYMTQVIFPEWDEDINMEYNTDDEDFDLFDDEDVDYENEYDTGVDDEKFQEVILADDF